MAVRSEPGLLRRVEFRLRGAVVPEAQRVALAGSFNHWDVDALQLWKGPDGDWRVVVYLPPGVHPYLYCVDGMWHNDPLDEGRMPTGWGNAYSLRVVDSDTPRPAPTARRPSTCHFGD